MSYYIHINGQRQDSPFTLAQLQKEFASSHIHDTTLLSKENDPEVIPLGDRISLRSKMPDKATLQWKSSSIESYSSPKSSPFKPSSFPAPPPRLMKKGPSPVKVPPSNNNMSVSKEELEPLPLVVTSTNELLSNQDDVPSETEIHCQNLDVPIPIQVIELLPSCTSVHNLVTLREPNETNVLQVLSDRFHQQLVYTKVGKLLISINPFQNISNKFTAAMYSSIDFTSLPPHVYQMAANTFDISLRSGQPQAIVISGESGSGKSEVAKLCLEYFSNMTSHGIQFETQLLGCSPILDAFGNALTVQNSNSSRFGKLIQLNLNESGRLDGCSITSYLLEKSRVTQVDENERNYHILHQVASVLYPNQSFSYLGNKIPTENDRIAFQSTLNALSTQCFTNEETNAIVAVCSGILCLGNINLDQEDLVTQEMLQEASKLFECTPDILTQCLKVRTFRVRGESMEMPLEGSQARANRDSLAKIIYSRLFDWLLYRMNDTMKSKTRAHSHIMLVDIFGFECFQRNGFEQLYINYANEKLQQLYCSVVFDHAIERYEREGLEIPSLNRPSNHEILDLLEGKPRGLLLLIDDEVSIPKASDQSLYSKFTQLYGKSPVFQTERGVLQFTLHHYAQRVRYHCSEFLIKNKDYVAEDLIYFMQNNCSKLIQEISMTSNKTDTTTGGKFRRQLKDLFGLLKKTSIHFIRCIKSNKNQIPNKIESIYVLDQLHQMGIFKALDLYHGGLYPHEELHEIFCNKYQMLTSCIGLGLTPREKSIEFIRTFPKPTGFQVGNTSVFISSEMNTWLRKERLGFETKATSRIQKIWRNCYHRHGTAMLYGVHEQLVACHVSELSSWLQKATDAAKRYPKHYKIHGLMKQMQVAQAKLEHQIQIDELLNRIQEDYEDLDAIERDLLRCKEWNLLDDPRVQALEIKSITYANARHVASQLRAMFQKKVIDVVHLNQLVQSSASVPNDLLLKAHEVLQIVQDEGTLFKELHTAILDTKVDITTLQSKFTTWSPEPLVRYLQLLDQREFQSIRMDSSIRLCKNLMSLRTILQTMVDGSVMDGLAALKIQVKHENREDIDRIILNQWRNESNLSRDIINTYDRIHKLLGKAWFSKVPQETTFQNLCHEMNQVGLMFGIPFESNVVLEAHAMLERIRMEKMFVVEVECLVSINPNYPMRKHLYLERLKAADSLVTTPPLYDKTEIACDVCGFLLKLRSSIKETFECTKPSEIELKWSDITEILGIGYKKFDILASDKWFRTIAYALEMEQIGLKNIYQLKQLSTRIGMQLEKAVASNCYEWLLDGLDKAGQVDHDYTIRDLVLRARNAVDLIQSIRLQLKQAIEVVCPKQLDAALVKAKKYKLHSRLVRKGSRLLKDLEKTFALFTASQFDIHRDRLELFVKASKQLRFNSEECRRCERLLDMSEERFLQEQLKWAIAQKASPSQLLELTLALKTRFFERCGDDFELEHFPRLQDNALETPAHVLVTTSLTDLTSAETKQATRASKCILSYIGDIPSVYHRHYGTELIHLGLESRRLADEIYIQQIHQLMKDEHHETTREFKAWELLWICVSFITPSDGCLNYIENYFRKSNKSDYVRQLHDPKPPAISLPTTCEIYRVACPSGIRLDGWVQIAFNRISKFKKRWLIVEDSQVLLFKDDSMKRDAMRSMDFSSLDTNDTIAENIIALEWSTKEIWNLKFSSTGDFIQWHQTLNSIRISQRNSAH